MSAAAWLLGGTIVTAVGGLLGTALLIRQQGRQSKTTDAQQIIDQLQEERDGSEQRHQQAIDHLEGRYLRELVEVRTEMTHLKDRQARVERRELVLLDYVARLRHHIDQGKGPPPPEWPSQLVQT